MEDALKSIKPEWNSFFNLPEIKEHLSFVDEVMAERNAVGDIVYPPRDQIFKIFELCSPHEIKAVILGQDPYHGLGQANGIAFGVSGFCEPPPSLVNIMKVSGTKDKTLISWVNQGIFMLNCALTVTSGKPNSHKKSWEFFTNRLIRYISDNCNDVYFLLWGGFAQSRMSLIDTNKHTILCSTHPSPLGAFRIGTKCGDPFMESNQFEILKESKGVDFRKV